jgi:hypothetical protein
MEYPPNRRSFLIAGGLTALASTRVLGANDTLRSAWNGREENVLSGTCKRMQIRDLSGIGVQKFMV